MEKLNKIVEKYGTDKVLHFLGGMLIELLFVLPFVIAFGETGAVISSMLGIVIVYWISWFKEYHLDEEGPDDKDIKAAMAGTAIALFYIVMWMLIL